MVQNMRILITLNMMSIFLTGLLLSTTCGAVPEETSPIIGFDCNKTEPEVLSISTLEIGPCPEVAELQPDTQTEYGQIIQKRSYTSTRIFTCQLIKSTHYFRCGKNWLNYQVYPPTVGEIKIVGKDSCMKIHNTGVYTWSHGHQPWVDLVSNTTYHFSVNEVGWTDSKGYCEGGSATIAGVSHTEIVVQSSFTLSLRDSYGKVDIENGKINIEHTLGCDYKLGTCVDARSGTHVWTALDQSCPSEKYVLLYQGPINITSSTSDPKTLLTVNNPPFLFTSELGTTSYTCGLTLRLTEFPDIMYIPQQNGQYQTQLPRSTVNDVKLITYLNAKITFTYHNLFDSARDMYLSAIRESCLVEREVLKNRIEIIRLNSAAGGLSSLLAEGMFAKVNGEVIHLVKCEPVAVTLRPSDTCYDALPITYQDKDRFLLPNTHIISPYASSIPCTAITPLTYKIGPQWWAYTGHFQQISAPTILKPQQRELPIFQKIRSFSKGGMYSEDQVEAVQKLLIFPSLREAISSDIAAGLSHFSNKKIHLDITSIMSVNDWKTMARKNIEHAWGVFSGIGNTISGLIGIYFVYRLLKGALNCVIDARELYKVFGCSFYILSAFWSRLALFFINKGRKPTDIEANTNNLDEDDNPGATAPEMIALSNYRSPLYPTVA